MRTKKMWPYTIHVVDGLKIKGYLTYRLAIWDQIKRSYNQGLNQGLKIKGCKIEGPLYSNKTSLKWT